MTARPHPSYPVSTDAAPEDTDTTRPVVGEYPVVVDGGVDPPIPTRPVLVVTGRPAPSKLVIVYRATPAVAVVSSLPEAANHIVYPLTRVRVCAPDNTAGPLVHVNPFHSGRFPHAASTGSTPAV